MRARAPLPEDTPSAEYSLSELAEAVNVWCAKAGITPANGQVGESLNERNLRFYRTVGLLDAPVAGGGRGYTERHLLQITAIRLLQAQGLPLRRIRELLFGRSLADLREIRERGRTEARATRAASASAAILTPGEAWQLLPVTSHVALLTKSSAPISAEQLRQIRAILGNPSASPAASGPEH
ncbi:MAG TPA: MerR family transcriptional regulator [Verrucomicrobiota bacterium]|nr:hypothetical protein [Verrucomicrobiales bacterium]HRI14239.1 MerR family transcriptional regulator [Verrucomicrobiota bacterium]